MSDNVTEENQYATQRFMYEFGCFVAFWGNFEMYMEVVIWKLSEREPIENCRQINKKTAGQKCKELRRLLKSAGRQGVIDALERVFEVAERNHWIHGVILNPNGDFSRLTRFRVHCGKVTNTDIDLGKPFKEFYQAYGTFEKVVESTLGISISVCNDYIDSCQQSDTD